MDRPRLSGASATPVRAQRPAGAQPGGGSATSDGASGAALPALLAPLAGADAHPWPHPRSLGIPLAGGSPAGSAPAAAGPKNGPVLPSRGAVPSRDSSVKRLAAQFGQSGGIKQRPATAAPAPVASPALCCSSLSPEPSLLAVSQQHQLALPAAVSALADAAVDGACGAALGCVYCATYVFCTAVWWVTAATLAWATALAWALALALGAAGLARDAWRAATWRPRVADAPAEDAPCGPTPPHLTRRQSLHALMSLREGALASPGSTKAAGWAAAAGAQAAHALRAAAYEACPSALHSGAFWAGVLLSLVSGRGALDDDAM